MKEKHELPSLKEIMAEEMQIVSKDIELQKLNTLLNTNPKKEWIKIHPVSSYKYIPVERQEYILTMIFGRWYLEVLNMQLIANSLAVTVRLHYYHPIYKEWLFMDGVGAVPVQVNKGAGATDFNAIKSSAVQMGLPSAKTFAFKDAVETLGKIFGKDLNRKEEIEYIVKYQTDTINTIKNLAKTMQSMGDSEKEEFLSIYEKGLSKEEIEEVKIILYGNDSSEA